MRKTIDTIFENRVSLSKQLYSKNSRIGGLYLEPSTITGKEVTDI